MMAERRDFGLFLQVLSADLASAIRPTFSWAYRRAAYVSRHRGKDVPSLSHARRLIQAEAGQGEVDGQSETAGSPAASRFLDLEAARQAARERMNARRNIFVPTPEEREELDVARRHRRIERAKEVLKVIQAVQLGGLPGDDDPAFDALAQRLSFVLFGQK